MNLLALAQTVFGARVPILCYHQVRPESGMTPQQFGRQLDLLLALGLRTMRLDALLESLASGKRPSDPSVVLTFDDATVDNWIHAVPELVKRNMTAAFFTITDFIAPGVPRVRADEATAPPTTENFGQVMARAVRGDCSGFMNQDELRFVERDLRMEVYAHSAAHQACFVSTRQVGLLGQAMHWSHPLLCPPNSPPGTPVHDVGSAYANNGFGPSWQGRPLDLHGPEHRARFCLEDFSRAKRSLEQLLGHSCPFLCLPWGQYDDITLTAAAKAGYQAVLTLDRTTSHDSRSGILTFGRMAVKDGKSTAWFLRKLLLHSLGTWPHGGPRA